MTYNPNQPRNPAGSPDGGQWTSIRAAAGLSGRNSHEEALMEYLDTVKSFFPQLTTEGYVCEHGKLYNPQSLPDSIKMGEQKGCFMNAARLSETKGLEYVEGYAFPEFMDFGIHHAWVVDSDGNVYDNTWEKLGNAYYGVEFSEKDLRYVLLGSGTYGVIDYGKEAFRELVGVK